MFRSATPFTGSQFPDVMPVLSRGKHRNPKRGACFMEFASYLAGESWSDHPSCTDPALASLARMVNDCTSDAERAKLVTLVPSVIGLTGDTRHTGLRLAVLAASAALPIASEGRQRALAAGMLRCEEILIADGSPAALDAVAELRVTLEATPGPSTWARAFLATTGPLSSGSVAMMNDAIIRTAVVGIADACVPDADDRLRALLTAAIADCTARQPETAGARIPKGRTLQPTR